jgi:GNAT superfamily N-acetyltransferase
MDSASCPYCRHATLRDGTAVTIRAARADDAPKIRKAFLNLDPLTRYKRFFAFKADISEAELTTITQADFEQAVVLLATIGAGKDALVIGAASYFVMNPSAAERSAELAFTVEEDFQGRGLASLLIKHLIEIARSKGLCLLVAEVLSCNTPMLKVLRHCGLPVTMQGEGNVFRLGLSLQQTS